VQPKLRKKEKASKLDSEVTTLTTGDLNDIKDAIHDATQDAVDKAMSKQQIVLGELRQQLQTLGIHVVPTSARTTTMGTGVSATDPLLKSQVTYSVAILASVLITGNTEDRAVLGRLTGLGLNVATLPRESLQQVQDSAMIELCTWKGRAKTNIPGVENKSQTVAPPKGRSHYPKPSSVEACRGSLLKCPRVGYWG